MEIAARITPASIRLTVATLLMKRLDMNNLKPYFDEIMNDAEPHARPLRVVGKTTKPELTKAVFLQFMKDHDKSNSDMQRLMVLRFANTYAVN